MATYVKHQFKMVESQLYQLTKTTVDVGHRESTTSDGRSLESMRTNQVDLIIGLEQGQGPA